MSHIPASAMPHASPRLHDAEQPAHGEVTAITPGATEAAVTGVSASQPETPVQSSPEPAEAKPTRSGWAVAALAVGGVALAAMAVGVPVLRRDEPASKRRGRKA